MRKATILAAGLLLAGAMAGCTKSTQGDPAVATAQSRGAGTNPTASASSSADPVRFAKCMREHGITWFTDPGTGAKPSPPSNVDDDKVDAARRACQQYAPGGPAAPPSLDPAVQERLLRHSKCMRENGVPNFPDMPTDGSGISLSQLGIDPKSPAYQAAQKKCQSLLPSANVGTGGNGG
jgi:hypothetical protein